MSKKAIAAYWLLLLLPTVFIATSAYRLLHHEQERIHQAANWSARERARSIGDNLQLTVATVEEELARSLSDIPGEMLAETLASWESRNPLIRNGFTWDPRAGILKPAPDASATTEERRFLTRYQALFSGRIPWSSAAESTAATMGTAPLIGDGPRPAAPEHGPVDRQSQSNRGSLVEMARRQPAEPGAVQPDSDGRSLVKSGWIPWFAENRLYILGWVQPTADSIVYGVELEVMTLLSRLILDFPPADSVPEDRVYALVNGRGEVLHQSGSTSIQAGQRPQAAISLSPQLPHWQVAVFFPDNNSANVKSGRGFLLLSGLLLSIFISAILLGGSLLTWQALRHHKDAAEKTSFVSNVSHELKTPLTSIRMYAELLLSGRIKTPEKKKRYLQVIVSESQRLTRLVNNVLDFSRLEQGRKTYRVAPLDLVQFLEDLTSAHMPQLAQSGVALRLILPDKAPVVHMDRDVIEQVLLNLLDNAVKYAAGGKKVTVALDRCDNRCRIRVMDRGPGVPVAHRDRIFDKFHRVDDSLTAVKPGSGLGLSIARRLLTDCGGDLRFDPRQGGGSVFTVSIPDSQPPTTQ